jgi:hypothetical protein
MFDSTRPGPLVIISQCCVCVSPRGGFNIHDNEAFFLAIALIVFARPCHAADIKANADGATTFPGHSSYLKFDIIGRIEPGDERKFLALPLVPHGTVYLASPGGSLDAAIAIGEHIHLNQYATTAMGSCASACALIWLAGSRKTILGGGNVGFRVECGFTVLSMPRL